MGDIVKFKPPRRDKPLNAGEMVYLDPEKDGHHGAILQIDLRNRIWVGGLGEPDAQWVIAHETVSNHVVVVQTVIGSVEDRHAVIRLLEALSAAIRP